MNNPPSDPASATNRLSVRKRDGLVEPFSSAKIIDGLRRALHAANDADPPATAEGIADAVVRYLNKAKMSGPLATSQILDLLESVLNQTGRSAAAQWLRQRARRRDRQRRAMHVAHFNRKQQRFVMRRWSKSAVVAALQRDYELGALVARQIAGIVEYCLLASGMKLITTALIEQAVISELLAWGLAPASLSVKGRSQGKPAPVREHKTAEQSD